MVRIHINAEPQRLAAQNEPQKRPIRASKNKTKCFVETRFIASKNGNVGTSDLAFLMNNEHFFGRAARCGSKNISYYEMYRLIS